MIALNIWQISGTKEPKEFENQCEFDDPSSCSHVKYGGCCMEWTALNYRVNPVMKVSPLKTYRHCTPKHFLDFILESDGSFTMREFSKMNFDFMKEH